MNLLNYQNHSLPLFFIISVACGVFVLLISISDYIIYRIGRIICCHSNNFIISKNTLPLGQRAFI